METAKDGDPGTSTEPTLIEWADLMQDAQDPEWKYLVGIAVEHVRALSDDGRDRD